MAVNAQQLLVCAARFWAKTHPGTSGIPRSAIRQLARDRGATMAEVDAAEKTLKKHGVLVTGYARGEYMTSGLSTVNVTCPADLQGHRRRKR